jgi:hypothetical protein
MFISKNKLDDLTIKLDKYSIWAFAVTSILFVFTLNINAFLLSLIIYLMFNGLWSLVVGRHYNAAYRTPEKMYKGKNARLVGALYMVIGFIFMYYFW